MRLRFQRYQLGLMALAMMLGLPAALQAAHPKPLVIPLQCTNGDCPLLRGMPQTAGMRSGYVRLLTGATIGWHTSGQNEESLVILQGQGQAMIEGHQACRSRLRPRFTSRQRHGTTSRILERIRCNTCTWLPMRRSKGELVLAREEAISICIGMLWNGSCQGRNHLTNAATVRGRRSRDR